MKIFNKIILVLMAFCVAINFIVYMQTKDVGAILAIIICSAALITNPIMRS